MNGQPRRRASTALAVALPLLTLALLLTFPVGSRPVGTGRAGVGAAAPVTRTVLGCTAWTPPPGTAVRTSVGLAPPAPTRAAPAGGHVRVTVPGGALEAVAVPSGALVALKAPGSARTGVLALGPAAPAVFAARTSVGRGVLTVTACPEPRAEWWFTGAGASLDHRSVLRLTNVERSRAVVDVDVLGARGSVDTRRTRGVTLAPGESRSLPLVAIAPGSDQLGLHVTASQGRVVASVSDGVGADRAADGGAAGGLGQEWLPSAGPPARDLVVAGVPATGGRRTLVLINPGDRQALLDLRIVTSEGAFVPRGLEQLPLAPGAARSIDLTAAVGELPASVRVRSDVDLIATVRTTLGRDEAVAVAAPPLAGPAVVTAAGRRTTLQLTATEAAATVRWRAFSATGRRLGGGGVVAPASGLVQWGIPVGTAYVLVEPQDGDGYVAAVHTGGGLAVQRPLELPAAQRRPAVQTYAGDRQPSGS